LALGCSIGKNFDIKKLRYERVIIMTDADIDGAHISSLLMTFFYLQMRPLIEQGHLYLSLPPLYRLTAGKETFYALDDVQKDKLMLKLEGKKVEISRFKGLGEMPAKVLKETTMNKAQRSLLRVIIRPGEDTQLIDRLMGKKAEERFLFIQENAPYVKNLDI
jgi:topoisomerase-4 subunit B